MSELVIDPGYRRAATAAGRSLLVIANANASRHDRLDPLLTALRRLGARVDLARTSDVAELAAAWAQAPAERIVLVGGDGTLHAAVNLPGPPREIALVPAGRANNVAHSLGIPYDWERAAALAVSGHVRPVDLIEARTGSERRLIVEGVSAGVLAQARAHYHGHNSSNLLSALGAGVAALSRYNPLEAAVRGDVATERLELAQLFIANLPFYAFGLCVAPHAEPADAMLDLIGIEAPTRRAVLAALRAIRRGRLLGLDGVHLWRAREAAIATSGCSPIVGDSSSLGFGPVLLRPVPAGLRLVRP